MDEFEEKLQDPTLKGAMFFAVCRGDDDDHDDDDDRDVLVSVQR